MRMEDRVSGQDRTYPQKNGDKQSQTGERGGSRSSRSGSDAGRFANASRTDESRGGGEPDQRQQQERRARGVRAGLFGGEGLERPGQELSTADQLHQ